jgi:glucan 1,3-beta-glucosidase
MPTDPRTAYGVCQNADPWTPPLSAWQTGGAGAGTVTASFAWPPAVISAGSPTTFAASLLPSYTPTGTVPTLPPPTFTPHVTVSVGNGWENPADSAGLMVAIGTCSYLDPWIGNANPPVPLCTGGAARRETEDAETPLITSAPS